MRGNYSYGRARETPYYQQSVHNRPVHRTLTSENAVTERWSQTLPREWGLVESMAEDIHYVPGEKNSYNGSLSPVLTLSDTDL